jgi:hypothetical protein
MGGRDLLRGFDPVQERHGDIHDGHIRVELIGQLDGLVPVIGHAHNFDIRLGIEQKA